MKGKTVGTNWKKAMLHAWLSLLLLLAFYYLSFG